MSRSGDAVPRQRAVNSTSHSRKADGVSMNASNTPHETVKHCHGEELGNIGEPLHKNDGHCIKDSCNNTNSEVITRVKWSEEEDKILTQMINKHGLKNWQTVSHAIPGRSAPQCRQSFSVDKGPKVCYIKILSGSTPSNFVTSLLDVIHWTPVDLSYDGPNGSKHRWRYKIDSAINKEAWSEQEELRLIRAHQIYGTKWREMVKHFPGRTNGAIKEYWRGPMKRKLNSYLASGLLDQFSDILENPSVPQNSDSDILKETKGLSDRNEMSSAVATSSKSELGFTEIGENADVSEGESADLMYVRGVDAPSAKAPQKIIERCEQHAKTKRKLDFLSSPVELKASAFAVNSPRPVQEKELVSPAVDGISPFNGCHDILPEVQLECANPVLSQTGSYQHSDIYSTEFSDPCSLELDISDLMEMSYFDNLMIFPPGSPHDGNSI